jgi:hypothetical protein
VVGSRRCRRSRQGGHRWSRCAVERPRGVVLCRRSRRGGAVSAEPTCGGAGWVQVPWELPRPTGHQAGGRGAVSRRGWAAPEGGATWDFLKEVSTVAGQPNWTLIVPSARRMAADLHSWAVPDAIRYRTGAQPVGSVGQLGAWSASPPGAGDRRCAVQAPGGRQARGVRTCRCRLCWPAGVRPASTGRWDDCGRYQARPDLPALPWPGRSASATGCPQTSGCAVRGPGGGVISRR